MNRCWWSVSRIADALPSASWVCSLFPGSLNVHDGDCLLQALDRIAAGRRSKFVRYIAGVSEVRDGFGDETVIQLLCVVDLMASRHAASMKVRDLLEVLLDIPADVAVHDLHVVNVEQQLDAR